MDRYQISYFRWSCMIHLALRALYSTFLQPMITSCDPDEYDIKYQHHPINTPFGKFHLFTALKRYDPVTEMRNFENI